MTQTLFDKLWDQHLVVPETIDHPGVMYIDLHLVHEVTSPQAFAELERRALKVRCPARTLATADHSIPTMPGRPFRDQLAKKQVDRLVENCQRHGVRCYGVNDPNQGIVHVIGPELGRTQPGMTIVCGDSHTSTHGAFGALAFGIGTSEVTGVLATQCLLQRKPKTCAIYLEGELQAGVSAKDVALFVISQIGASGGTGHVLEYKGSAVRAMNMAERMTLCNMSIEAGARAGMIAADDTTIKYLKERVSTASASEWQKLETKWRAAKSDSDAIYDRTVHLDVTNLQPMITYGTSPDAAIAVTDPIPLDADPRALDYMGFTAGMILQGTPVDMVFLGSCTNSRIEDLRIAADALKGRKVNPKTKLLVVPGSGAVKRQAEDEGLVQIFKDAGADWREPGCSMCIAMNGDQLQPGQLAVSTSNRNFEGRQGPGGRTLLASPLTAMAAAINGVVSDCRTLMNQEVCS